MNGNIYKYISTHVYTYMCTMEYCPATEKTEVFSYATTWMDLEGIMLGEVNQAEKDKFHMILFIWGILNKSEIKTPSSNIQKQVDG